MRNALILLALVGLAGCISGTTMLHSPDGNHVVVCTGAGLWMIPGTMASTKYHNCRETYLKSGYIEGTPPAHMPPMPTPPLPLQDIAP